MTDQPQAPNLSAVKDRQQKTWTSGDFARIGNLMVLMGERLCEAVDLRAGSKVLDVAAGSGNTAMSAARRFCEVRGVDYVPELIEYARKRSEVEQMEVTFEVGDAENLPYPDTSFDVVLSTIGVMFAPDQEKVASELLRVCRPGGKIGIEGIGRGSQLPRNRYIGSSVSEKTSSRQFVNSPLSDARAFP